MKATLRSYSALIGTIIGAGIFGVPYAIAKSGIVMGIALTLSLGAIMILFHLMYGEVLLSTREKHRLPGLVEKYLGVRWARFAKVSSTLGYYGSILAYIILGGKFSFLLLGPVIGGTEFIYQFLYAILFSLLIYLGTNPIAKIETFLTIALVFLLSGLALTGIFHFDVTNVPLWSTNIENAFFPYGILLFSLFGLPAIPGIIDILGEEKNKLKKIIITGVSICIGITILFAISAIGIGGTAVSPEAIQTFSNVLGPNALILGSLIGFLAISTSLLFIGLYITDQFKYDFKFGKKASLLFTMLPPIIILFFTQDFILIMGFIGAIFSATDSLLLVSIWHKAKTNSDVEPPYRLNISKYFVIFILLIFLAGALQEILSLI